MATPTSHVPPSSTEARFKARWMETIANGRGESCSKVSSLKAANSRRIVGEKSPHSIAVPRKEHARLGGAGMQCRSLCSANKTACSGQETKEQIKAQTFSVATIPASCAKLSIFPLRIAASSATEAKKPDSRTATFLQTTHPSGLGPARHGELKKIQVWLLVNRGRIEFLIPGNSYKVKRARRNPQVICYVGSNDGPCDFWNGPDRYRQE